MADEEKAYERKRMHDLLNKVYENQAASILGEEKIQNLSGNLVNLQVEVQRLVNQVNIMANRITELETNLKTYNKAVWILVSALASALVAWYIK
jgi:peptidoglycan hydrolase CwlO-like protein